MINKRKIEIYKKYGGDSDGFARCATEIEKQLINDKDWSMIDNAIQDCELIRKNLCSKEYKSMILKKLKVDFDKASIEFLDKKIK